MEQEKKTWGGKREGAGRKPYQWGATEFLKSLELMKKVEYDESK